MKLFIVVSLARVALHMICDTLSFLRTEEISDNQFIINCQFLQHQ